MNPRRPTPAGLKPAPLDLARAPPLQVRPYTRVPVFYFHGLISVMWTPDADGLLG